MLMISGKMAGRVISESLSVVVRTCMPDIRSESERENAKGKEQRTGKGFQQQDRRPGTQRSGLQCRKLFLGMHVVPLCGGMHNIVKHQLGFLFYLCHALHLECRGFYVASSQDTNLISVIPEGVLHQLGQYGEIMSAR